MPSEDKELKPEGNHHPICVFAYQRYIDSPSKVGGWNCQCNLFNEYNKSKPQSPCCGVEEIEQVIRKELNEKFTLCENEQIRHSYKPIACVLAKAIHSHFTTPKCRNKSNEDLVLSFQDKFYEDKDLSVYTYSKIVQWIRENCKTFQQN